MCDLRKEGLSAGQSQLKIYFSSINDPNKSVSDNSITPEETSARSLEHGSVTLRELLRTGPADHPTNRQEESSQILTFA